VQFGFQLIVAAPADSELRQHHGACLVAAGS
jgi:hypothetical protein